MCDVQGKSNHGSPRQLRETHFSDKDDKNIEVREKNDLDQSVSSCLICFEGQPDAVYTPCGHGGICYECAIELMKKSEECFLCREVTEKFFC